MKQRFEPITLNSAPCVPIATVPDPAPSSVKQPDPPHPASTSPSKQHGSKREAPDDDGSESSAFHGSYKRHQPEAQSPSITQTFELMSDEARYALEEKCIKSHIRNPDYTTHDPNKDKSMISSII